ncbi:hypothetical protein DXG01_006313 [Tephrocybe rancida]|nr:hypothetical protein DXG01_006313 [Tephrocybe rancida]
MVDTRRTASAKTKAKPPAPTKQRTLFDLFAPKATKLAETAATKTTQVVRDESTQPTSVASSSSVHSDDLEEIAMRPMVEQLRQASLEPTRPLHPFFSKPSASLPVPAPVKPDPPREQESIIEIIDEDIPIGQDSTDPPASLPEEGGSQEDPIVLDSSPLRPLRRPKTTASKPLASSFAPRWPKAAPMPSTAQSPEVTLIELPEQATKPKKLAPLFAPRPTKASPALPSTRAVKAKDLDAPFPNKESLHVRGVQHVFSAPSLPYSRRAAHSDMSSASHTVADEPGPLNQFLVGELSSTLNLPSGTISSDPETYMNTIPDEDRKHPAITRFSTTAQTETSEHRLWVDKWRPTCAAEVLGNEENATYLRDWIRALELQLRTNDVPDQGTSVDLRGKGKGKADPQRGTKRPRVVRAVEKRRGRKKRRVDSDDEDDWIVHSADEFSSVAASSPPPYDRTSSPPRSSPAPKTALVAEQSSTRYTFDPLTNTILLAGPSGSGKTAAVYACAEELGWDVLEVYPGIGRRNGAGVDGLIGDAGKNHHVRKSRAGHLGALGTSEGPDNIFKDGKADSTDVSKGDDNVEPVPTNGGSSFDPTLSNIRQSLILLEEVDILFKEDTNFWPAVTNFIKDCRRPVICTCNERNTLLRLYEGSAPNVGAIDIPDIPNPATSGDFPAPDLRRTINGVQFLCDTASGIGFGPEWEPEQNTVGNMWDWDWPWGNTARKEPNTVSADHVTVTRTEAPPRDHVLEARHADLISFVDTYLMREPWNTQEGLSWSACEASNDDELGHGVLFYPQASRSWFGAGLYTRDTEMASVAMWLSRGAFRAGTMREPRSVSINPCRTRELFRVRVHHQLEVGRILDGIVPLSVMTMRRKEVHLEYLTSVRDIVAAEDMWELAYLQRERSGRMTRNSGGSYERVIEVTEECRAALGETVLLSQI